MGIVNIVEFVTARISEDERAAQTEKRRREGGIVTFSPNPGTVVQFGNVSVGVGGGGGGSGSIVGDPDRALREVAAKRELIIRNTPTDECRGHPGPWLPHGEYGPGFCREPEEASVYHVLAAIYSDHPDYDPTWSE